MAAKEFHTIEFAQKNGQPFTSLAQALAGVPQPERTLATVLLVQSGADVERYYFEDGITDADVKLWEENPGTVESVTGNIVDNTDPRNPVITGVSSIPYINYVARLTQSGTDAPEAVILQNNIGVTGTWTHENTGVFRVTFLIDITDYTKVWYSMPSYHGSGDNRARVTSLLGNSGVSLIIEVSTDAYSGGNWVASNNVLDGGANFGRPIEIRLYEGWNE